MTHFDQNLASKCQVNNHLIFSSLFYHFILTSEDIYDILTVISLKIDETW